MMERGQIVEYPPKGRSVIQAETPALDGTMPPRIPSSFAFHMGHRRIHDPICIEGCTESQLEARLIEGAQAAIAAGAGVPDYATAWVAAADDPHYGLPLYSN